MKIINTYTDQELAWFHAYNIDLTKVFTFRFDGDIPDATFNATNVSPELQHHAMMFGLTNRVKDTAAIARKDTPNGQVTEAMRREKVQEMIDHLESGGTEWNLKASGRKPTRHPKFVDIAEREGITYEEALERAANQYLTELGE